MSVWRGMLQEAAPISCVQLAQSARHFGKNTDKAILHGSGVCGVCT